MIEMKKFSYSTWLAAFIFLLCFFFAYWKIFQDLVFRYSNDPNYSHGFIIPLISAYIVWTKRAEIKLVVRQPSQLGLLVIVVGLALFLVGTLAAELFTTQISMLVVLAGIVVYFYGLSFLRAIAFPFGFLIFMIPLPYIIYDSIAFPLKLMVSKYSVELLKLVGVPILREGNVLYLPRTTLEVADACSGIRSMISLLAMGAAMGYLFLEGFLRRAVLVLLAIPIAVFANGVRVVGTGLLALKYGEKAAEGFFHEFAGLVIFGVSFLMMGGAMAMLARIGKNRKEVVA